MLYRCKEGCELGVGMGERHMPTRCTAHGEPYRYAKQLGHNGKRSTLKRTKRRETAAEKEARQRFREAVLSWPCFFRGRRDCERCGGDGEGPMPGTVGGEHIELRAICPDCHGTGQHTCSGPKDAHHLVEQQFIRRNYSDLPEDKLLAIRFAPEIGAPLCRSVHDAIKRNPIYWHELTEECKEFCAETDERYLGVLTPWGGQRQSMVERLRHECPGREAVAHG